MDEFLVICIARFGLVIAAILPLDFQKAGDFAHFLFRRRLALARVASAFSCSDQGAGA